jgi:hypothetical protein
VSKLELDLKESDQNYKYAAAAMNVIAEPPRAYEVVYEKAEGPESLTSRSKVSNLISFLRTQLASHVPPKAGWPSDKKGLLQRFQCQNFLSRLSLLSQRSIGIHAVDLRRTSHRYASCSDHLAL